MSVRRGHARAVAVRAPQRFGDRVGGRGPGRVTRRRPAAISGATAARMTSAVPATPVQRCKGDLGLGDEHLGAVGGGQAAGARGARQLGLRRHVDEVEDRGSGAELRGVDGVPASSMPTVVALTTRSASCQRAASAGSSSARSPTAGPPASCGQLLARRRGGGRRRAPRRAPPSIAARTAARAAPPAPATTTRGAAEVTPEVALHRRREAGGVGVEADQRTVVAALRRC